MLRPSGVARGGAAPAQERRRGRAGSEDTIAEKDGGARGVLRLLKLVMLEDTAAPRQGVRPASTPKRTLPLSEFQSHSRAHGSVYLRAFSHGPLEGVEREVGAARHFQDRHLAPGAEFRSAWDLARDVLRMTTAPWRSAWIRVVGAHHHAEPVDRAAERDRVHPGMRGRHLATQLLELGRHGLQVAHAGVGDQALAPDGFVDRGLHLAPEAAGRTA
jgi:hypothetical protein